MLPVPLHRPFDGLGGRRNQTKRTRHRVRSVPRRGQFSSKPRTGRRVRTRQASITRLRGLDGIQVNRFCGNCHRSQVQGRASIDLNYVWNVRHQPPYLERSACFQSSSGRLSCLTCHDPHQPLRRTIPTFTRPSACPATDVPYSRAHHLCSGLCVLSYATGRRRFRDAVPQSLD